MIEVLRLFGKALATESPRDFYNTNKLALKVGYVVPPQLCSLAVVEWLKEKKVNHNATFYKTWKDVTSKNRFELFIDQIFHYASTYGTNFEGEVYLPNENPKVKELKSSSIKILEEITLEEAQSRALGMLQSGAALAEATIKDIIVVLGGADVDVDSIKNREALMHFCKAAGTFPRNTTEFVRFLVFLKTGKTLLIKDRETIAAIRASKEPVRKLIFAFGMERLAEVFLRFKPLFLAMRCAGADRPVINRLRRLAVTNHRPMPESYWTNVLNRDIDKEFVRRLPELNNFRKVSLLQTILVRLNQCGYRAFGIRNGKLFIQEGNASVNQKNLHQQGALIYESLVQSISAKACRIKLPENINLTVPTSEKSFIGNFPLGSSIPLRRSNSIIGIHWRGNEGARDIDLSFFSLDGRKFGWNAAYTNSANSIVYSGDMTSADPEAVELLYAKSGFTPGIVKANIYSGQEVGAKFKMFFAQEDIKRMGRNYMVDPNNIIFSVDFTSESRENILGVLTKESFFLAKFRSGRGRVSGTSTTEKYRDYVIENLNTFLPLKELLIASGFEIVTENPDVDLSNPVKDSLLSLLA